jgi:thiopeptide-type bacteriocin biosynthesis protein
MRFAIETYEREIERYGGEHSIDWAEQLFSHDSESALALLRLLDRQCPLLRVELAVLGLDFLFRGLGCSNAQRLAFFKGIAPPRQESGPAFRQRKRVLQAIVGSHEDSSVAETIRAFSSALERYGPAIFEIGRRLLELEAQGLLAVPLDDVFKSCAHMHCNRVGLDATAERLAYGLLARSYATLQTSSRPDGNLTNGLPAAESV